MDRSRDRMANKLSTALVGERYGVVVVFEAGTTYDEALSALTNMPHVDQERSSTVQDYDPKSGDPVWYIP